MTFLTDTFTPAQLLPITDGIRKFIRMMGLIHDPSPLVYLKWLADESELKAAIWSVATAIKRTEPMIGKRKYQGMDYDAPREVKKDLISFLTTTSEGLSATLQKRNLPMYYLVVEPVINLFYTFPHEEMIANADKVAEAICEAIDQCTDYGTLDDALVAQQQARDIIRQHEEAAKEERARKTRRKKVRDPVAELMASLGLNLEEEPEDELLL